MASSICIALAPVPALIPHRHTVVGSILLAADQLFGVEELAISARPDLINWLCDPESSIKHVFPTLFKEMTYARVEIGEDRAGNVFAVARLGEEGIVDAVGANIFGAVGIDSSIGLEAVL